MDMKHVRPNKVQELYDQSYMFYVIPSVYNEVSVWANKAFPQGTASQIGTDLNGILSLLTDQIEERFMLKLKINLLTDAEQIELITMEYTLYNHIITPSDDVTVAYIALKL